MHTLLDKVGRDTLTVVGLISGTSADGIDAAVVRFNGKGFKVLEHSTTPYPKEIRERLFEFFDDRASLREVARMDRKIGGLFAAVVEELMNRHEIDLVASHGQTVCHLPEDGATMQLGEAALIAKRSGIMTVSDFRQDDMALGGQGAPAGSILRCFPAARAGSFSGRPQHRGNCEPDFCRFRWQSTRIGHRSWELFVGRLHRTPLRADLRCRRTPR